MQQWRSSRQNARWARPKVHKKRARACRSDRSAASANTDPCIFNMRMQACTCVHRATASMLVSQRTVFGFSTQRACYTGCRLKADFGPLQTSTSTKFAWVDGY